MELGKADAKVFVRTEKTSKSSGTVDYLTNSQISRTNNITQACKLALIPLMPYNSKYWPTALKSDAGGGASSR